MALGSFKKNTFWLILQQLFGIGFALIVGPLVARTLGPQGVGDLTYGENIVTMYYTVSQLGMNNIMIAELIQHPDNEEKAIGTALVLRLVSSLFFMMLSAVTVFILKPDSRVIQISTLIQMTMILVQIYDVFNYWFQARLLSKYFTWISMFSLIVFNGYRIWHIIHHGDVIAFSYGNTIRYTVTLILMVIVFFRLNPGFRPGFDRDIAKRILARSKHFVAASIGSIVYIKVDGLMVGSMINSENLAFYSLAVTLCSIWETIPTSIIASAQPVILENRKVSEKAYLDTYQLSLLGILLLSLVVCLGGTLLGRPVIMFLYGDQFKNTIPIFCVVLWSTMFALLDAARSTWIISEHYERQAKYFVYIGAVTDIVLNWFFIRRWGAFGAAFATLATHLVVFFIAPCLFRETRVHNRIFFGCFKQWPLLKELVRKNIIRIAQRLGIGAEKTGNSQK